MISIYGWLLVGGTVALVAAAVYMAYRALSAEGVPIPDLADMRFAPNRDIDPGGITEERGRDLYRMA